VGIMDSIDNPIQGGNRGDSDVTNITDLMSQAQNLASSAGNMLGGLGTAISNIQPPDVPSIDVGNPPTFQNIPSPPTVTRVDFSAIGRPPEAKVGEVSPLSRPASVPQFTAPDPSVRTINAPDKFNKPAPEVTPLASIYIPEARDIEIPTLDSLRAIILPEEIKLNDYLFDGIKPGELYKPNIPDFNFSEDRYRSDLQDTLNAKLLDYVSQNITGIDPTIEQQLFDRARERTNATTKATIINVSRRAAASGWDQPIGDQYDRIAQAEEQANAEAIAESRNVAITQANLIQQKFHQALGLALQHENQLIQYVNNYAQRSLDAAKAVVQFAVDAATLLVTQYNAEAQVYNTYAQVYKTRVDADLARLEQVRIKLEGQKLIGELNQQDVERYKAEIEAQSLIVQIYKEELEASRIKLEHDRIRIQAVESEVKIYEADIKAKALEYDGYKTEQEAELLKVQTHEALAKAYEAKIRGYEALIKSDIAFLDSEIKVKQEIPVEIAKIEAELYKIHSEAVNARGETNAKIDQVRAAFYDSQVKGMVGAMDAQASNYNASMRAAEAQATMAAAQMRASAETSISQARLAVEAQKGAAQVAAQLASSAMSAINFSASVSHNTSESYGESVSYSASNSSSHIHTKPYAEGDN